MKYKLTIQLTKQIPFDADLMVNLRLKFEEVFFWELNQQLLTQLERQIEFIQDI